MALSARFAARLRTLCPSWTPLHHLRWTQPTRHMATGDWASPRPVVGVVQMTSMGDKDANFNQAKALIGRAKAMGAQMVFLPECFDYICDTRKESLANAETIDGDLIGRYRDLARANDLWLSLGGFHEKPSAEDGVADGDQPRIYNTHVMVDREGNIAGRYSKTHLFDVDIPGRVTLRETDWTIPGNTIAPPVVTPVGSVGMGICYDMRFPEMSLALAQQGAEILTYPSAFTVPTGLAHWHPLLRSRAIETQCYVIAAAQVGKHNAKRSSYGHAMVVDPWGCVLAECQDSVDVAVAQIDLDYLRKRRQEMPVWNHRRHDLYGTIQTHSKCSIQSQPSYVFGDVTVRSDQVFHRTALSYAFVNRKPVLPGHVLVSSLRPARRLADLSPAEVADLFQCVQTVSRAIQTHYNATSLSIAVQDGPDAGQTIDHIHVHILPRRPMDFQRNDDVYKELEKHDKDVAPSAWRTDDAMAEEALKLRPYFN